MTHHDLHTLIIAGHVSGIVLYDGGDGDGYEVWPEAPVSPSALWSEATRSGERLRTARGSVRRWRSADRAIDYIRRLGYSGRITVEAPNA